jgi:AcrR family transcriptional regulator
MSAKPRIERAALEVFVRDGVDAATTRAIATEAGVSEGALYRHYRSKDELAITLFMTVHRRLSGLIEESAASATGIKAKAAAIVQAYCQEDGRDPVSVVETVIKQAMISAELPPADPRVLAAMAIGVITQTAQNKAYGRIGDDPLSAHALLMTAAVQAVLLAR